MTFNEEFKWLAVQLGYKFTDYAGNGCKASKAVYIVHIDTGITLSIKELEKTNTAGISIRNLITETIREFKYELQ